MSNMPMFENPCGAYSRYEITKYIPLDRLEAICAAERDGRLVVLPCKVGDTVYFLIPELEMGEGGFNLSGLFISEPHRITEVGTRGFWTSGLPRDEPDGMHDFTPWGDLGKTVFLTREEAEAARERSRAMNADVERAMNWLKGMADDRGYTEHLAHGGKGDPIEEQEIECASTALKYIESLQAQLAKEKRRAERAVEDLAFACGSQPNTSDDCSICDICKYKQNDGSCPKQCFMNSLGASNRWQWRGDAEEDAVIRCGVGCANERNAGGRA